VHLLRAAMQLAKHSLETYAELGISSIMPTPGLCHLGVPVHESRVTSVQDRGELRASDEVVSVDPTEARKLS
jgi:hypothetical protein